MLRDESIINILTYETPRDIPENDIFLDEKEKSIQTILNWRPNTTVYDKYSDELQKINHDFKRFRDQKKEISTIEIKQIIIEYNESKMWSRSLDKYEKLEVPYGFIEENYRLRFLIKERNRLPSRRTFIKATMDKRVNTENNFKRIFNKCGLQDYSNYAQETESILFGLSKLPEDYDYYYDILSEGYEKLCEFLKDKDPNILSKIVTEFLIKEGDFENVNINRIINFSGKLDTNNDINNYIKDIRGKEIDAYLASLETVKNPNIK